MFYCRVQQEQEPEPDKKNGFDNPGSLTSFRKCSAYNLVGEFIKFSRALIENINQRQLLSLQSGAKINQQFSAERKNLRNQQTQWSKRTSAQLCLPEKYNGTDIVQRIFKNILETLHLIILSHRFIIRKSGRLKSFVSFWIESLNLDWRTGEEVCF